MANNPRIFAAQTSKTRGYSASEGAILFGNQTKILSSTPEIVDRDGNRIIYRGQISGGVDAVISGNFIGATDDGISFVLMSTGNGDRTATLPPPSSSTGRLITIKKTDTGTGRILVSTPSGTIDGAPVFSINGYNATATFYTDGTDWFVTTDSGFIPGPSLSGRITVFINVSLADVTPTTICNIITANESGSNDGGCYAFVFQGLVCNGATATTADSASKAVTYTFARAMRGDGLGTSSSVQTIQETNVAATTAGQRSITAIAASIFEPTEYNTQFRIDANGTGALAPVLKAIGTATLVYSGFNTPPEVQPA